MKTRERNNEYAKLGTKELIALISEEYFRSMGEGFDTVVMQLETSGKIAPEDKALVKIQVEVKRIREMFMQHAGKEQRFLFPLFQVNKKEKREAMSREELESFLDEMRGEHEQLRKEFETVGMLTHHFNFEPTASPSQKLAFAQLNDLEQDFNRMIFVEEEYLFPRVWQFYK